MALQLNAYIPSKADKSSDNLDVNSDPPSDLISLGTPKMPTHRISTPIKSFDVVLLAGYFPGEDSGYPLIKMPRILSDKNYALSVVIKGINLI